MVIIVALVKILISQFNEETDWFTPLFLSTKKGKLWKGNLKTMLLDFFGKNIFVKISIMYLKILFYNSMKKLIGSLSLFLSTWNSGKEI